MTGYYMTAKAARVQAGESGIIVNPRIINGSGRYGIIACHGAGGDYTQWPAHASWPNLSKLLTRAAHGGIPSISEHLGGDTFGNATGVSRVAAALTAMASETGCSSTKAHLVGASMGAAVALEYAIANPTKVASMTLLIPLTSMINAAKTNPPTGTEANAAGNLPSIIATAWGTTYRTVTDGVTTSDNVFESEAANFVEGDVGSFLVSKSVNGIVAGTSILSVTDENTVVMSAAASTTGSSRIVGIAAPLPAGADLLANAGTLSGIPTRFYYAPDDTLINPSDVTAMATAMGGSASATATSGGGHANTGLLPGGFDFDAWVAWLITNGG